MARNAAGDATLADVKAVGPAWPPHRRGAIRAARDAGRRASRATDGAYGAEVDDILLDRLGLKIGDTFRIGDLKLVIRGQIVNEPDRLGAGHRLWRAGADLAARRLAASGLVQPGSLVRWTTRVTMNPGGAAAAARRRSRR